jgi:hypothetical protein
VLKKTALFMTISPNHGSFPQGGLEAPGDVATVIRYGLEKINTYLDKALEGDYPLFGTGE